MIKDLAEIKKSGFIPQRQKDKFSLRLKVTGGALSTEDLQGIIALADDFGKGRVHLTSRQGVEIPFIKLKDIDKVLESLKRLSIEPGCIGPGVRTICACQGASACARGWVDSGRIARDIDKKFSQLSLPHKFKIGVTGCANNCLKAEGNDLGIKGAVTPSWQPEKCIYCKLCAKACPGKAITVQEDSLAYNRESCISCGRCIKSRVWR